MDEAFKMFQHKRPSGKRLHADRSSQVYALFPGTCQLLGMARSPFPGATDGAGISTARTCVATGSSRPFIFHLFSFSATAPSLPERERERERDRQAGSQAGIKKDS